LLEGSHEGFFAICKANEWAYQCTFKKGNLTTVWDEIHTLSDLNIDQSYYTTTRYVPGRDGNKEMVRTYHWINDVDYNSRSINNAHPYNRRYLKQEYCTASLLNGLVDASLHNLRLT
jgi:hypothetical protein